KETMWPVYDRQIHDVVPEAEHVDAEIILLEGNWLLLKDERWTNVRVFADYSVLIRSEPELLKDRLIQRKVQGGKSRQDAEAFYENSDKHNVERVLQDSGASDEVWMMLDDGDFELAEQSETVQV
ncbi:MAG: nucleoside/nucleotide kinase family protein, partial [Selenomonadaceae bacterium]|nr:nucleoside/nucleotide kinase family protein [Selenomonadaceae bacterium]